MQRVMKTASSGQVLIFLHLPKTAGSTLARIIQRQYGANGSLAQYESNSGAELAKLTPIQLKSVRAIMGHFYFGVHEFLPRSSTYVTLLRDPIERVISYYYYVQNQPEHYLYQAAREMNLSKFVIACNLSEPNNDQTRLLAATEQGFSSGTCLPEMLGVAKQNLQDHFAVVGLTEDFDRSLILMKRVFGWNIPFYVRHNVTWRRPRKEDIPRETLKVIETYNKLDIELYSYGRGLFQELVRAQKGSFEKELRMFKKVNMFYGKIQPLTLAPMHRLRTRHS